MSFSYPAKTEVVVSPLCLVWQHVKLSDVNLGTCPRDILGANEEVKKKPTNQPNKAYHPIHSLSAMRTNTERSASLYTKRSILVLPKWAEVFLEGTNATF